MQLYLVVVELEINTTLLHDLRSKGLDVVLCLEFLLELSKDIQTQYLVVALCFLAVLSLDNLREFHVKGISDIIDIKFCSQSTEVDEIAYGQDTLTQLSCDVRHLNFVHLNVDFKLCHSLLFAHLDDSALHIFQALVHLALSCYQALCLIDGIIDLLSESRDVSIHLSEFNEYLACQLLSEIEGHAHGLQCVIVGEQCLMLGIAACTHIDHTLKQTELAPFCHVVLAVLVASLIVIFLFLGASSQFFANLSHSLQQQFRYLL